jgi:alanine dehydrogenase
MIVGVPKEIKEGEFRVAMTPGGANALVTDGHQVLVECGAGNGSGIADDEYRKAGAELVAAPQTLYERAELVMKVKEPMPSEYPMLRRGQMLFTYLHLASSEELIRALLDAGIIGIAYETVQTADLRLPLLEPMSEVAGKMASQVAAQYLQKHFGGRGVLMGGVTGVKPAEVVVLGCGFVGANAVKVAAGMGARVSAFDINTLRLAYLDDTYGSAVTSLYSNPWSTERSRATSTSTATTLIRWAHEMPAGSNSTPKTYRKATTTSSRQSPSANEWMSVCRS